MVFSAIHVSNLSLSVIKITLPYPPSVNRLWRHVGHRVLVSKEGRQYRVQVAMALRMAGIEPLEGPVSLEIVLQPPDRRRRDLDNCLKILIDSLEHGGAFADDSQVKRLLVEWGDPVKDGQAIVSISEYKRRK